MTDTESKAFKKRVEALSKMHPKDICKEIGLKHHSTLLAFINSSQVYPSAAALVASMELANWFYVTSGVSSNSVASLGKRIGRHRASAHRDIADLLDRNYWVQVASSGHAPGPNRYTLTPHVFAELEEYINQNSRNNYLPCRIDKEARLPESTFKPGVVADLAKSSDNYTETV